MIASSASLLAELTASQRAQLDAYAAAMLRWNQKINVTAARTTAEILDHCVDGIVASRLIPQDATTLVDIGSGGGLPLIPMAIMRPEVAMTGIEPIAKKWAFLVSCSRDLGLRNVAAEQGRAEQLASERVFDVASSKATFELGRWLELGLGLVKASGGAVLSFGSSTATPVVDASSDLIEFERGGARYWISRSWRRQG